MPKNSLGALLACTALTVGCTPHTAAVQETTVRTELPPLITTVTQTQPATETLPETTEPVALYGAQMADWALPEEITELRAVRCDAAHIYLLGNTLCADGTLQNTLYTAPLTQEPVFEPLLSAQSDALAGLQDFDILSDGMICGLVCDAPPVLSSAPDTPAPSPEEAVQTQSADADDQTAGLFGFPAQTAPEESETDTLDQQPLRYRVVWFDRDGIIRQRLDISALFYETTGYGADPAAPETQADTTDTYRRTAVFTGLRCDNADQIYLTAYADDCDYLMALQPRQNALCPVQGTDGGTLTLQTGYQWARAGTEGLVLCEQSPKQSVLSHIIVKDGTLWDLPLETAQTALTLTQTCPAGALYGYWDSEGVWSVQARGQQPAFLYAWQPLHMDAEEIQNVVVLPDAGALLTTYAHAGRSAAHFIFPETDETHTEAVTTAPPPAETAAQSETLPPAPPAATPAGMAPPEAPDDGHGRDDGHGNEDFSS